MEDGRYRVTNKTLEKEISAGVTLVNSTREPLAALRVMVEGLGAGEETGLWLTQVTVLPMVPRLSPFDLVYLDAENRVVERVELMPTSEIPRFKKPATSALVLPFRTVSSTKIEVGHQFAFDEVPEPRAATEAIRPEPAAIAKKTENAKPAPPIVAPEPIPALEAPFLNPFLSAAPEPVPEPPKASKIELAPPPQKKEKEFALSDFLRTEPAEAIELSPERETERHDVPVLTPPAAKARSKKAGRRQRAVPQVPSKVEPATATSGAKSLLSIDSSAGSIRPPTQKIDAAQNAWARRDWLRANWPAMRRACMKWATSVPKASICARRNDGSPARFFR